MSYVIETIYSLRDILHNTLYHDSSPWVKKPYEGSQPGYINYNNYVPQTKGQKVHHVSTNTSLILSNREPENYPAILPKVGLRGQTDYDITIKLLYCVTLDEM